VDLTPQSIVPTKTVLKKKTMRGPAPA
jgi:hypothetical protein